MAGLLHPVTGPDHLLATLAVGILSVQLGGANIWRIPAAFVFAVAMGAWAGVHGWKLPGYEAAIAWSVVVLGVALYVRARTAHSTRCFAASRCLACVMAMPMVRKCLPALQLSRTPWAFWSPPCSFMWWVYSSANWRPARVGA